MSETIQSAPLLSTPAEHIFQDDDLAQSTTDVQGRLTDEQLYVTYEIKRTVAEIRKGKWTRVALQFPDAMLPDAPRVFEHLRTGLQKPPPGKSLRQTSSAHEVTEDMEPVDLDAEETPEVKPYILADTSYGSCCVDEVASEHVNADVVVHYGRSCLSPTARLPVIYVFTEQPIDFDDVIRAFISTYQKRDIKVILMADIPFSSHVPRLYERLREITYTNVFATDIVHNPSSALPNRTVPPEVEADPSKLGEWELFHVADPPQALVLTLSSRVSQMYICPTYPTSTLPSEHSSKPIAVSTARALSRRYALLTSVATVPIFGILINTLSVKNYIHIVEHVKSRILAAGKKSYTFVVGKINAAKVANFSEIGAWVVIGCWESSLVESKDFWKPVITPFELELALKKDKERVWTGEWRSDFQGILDAAKHTSNENRSNQAAATDEPGPTEMNERDCGELDSEGESSPPEFDLRTGRYVSHSKPMQPSLTAANRTTPNDGQSKGAENTLIKRAKGDLAVIGGEASPGADYLQSKRTWKGLGSDFEIAYEEPDQAAGMAVEEGRSGIARGYVHGEGLSRT